MELAKPPSSPTARTSHRRHGLYVDVWEAVESTWECTHQFNTGLELDSKESLPKGSNRSRVHLPSTSLRALQHLKTSLQREKAVSLGVKAKSSGGYGSVLAHLLERTSSAMGSASRNEAWEKLGALLAQAQEKLEDAEVASCGSEALVQPEHGREAVDICVLTLNNFPREEPIIGLAHLAKPVPSPHGKVAMLRFVVLICASPACASFCVDLAKACAVSFMDENFVACVASLPGHAPPQQVLDALETCFATLTIVPTVWMDGDGSKNGAGVGRSLEDFTCEQMEKYMSHASGIKLDKDGTKIHHKESLDDGAEKQQCPPYFIEIDELLSPASMWRMTHRLRRGLEVDVTSLDTRPHLPHVSTTALQLSRQLMSPSSINLNVNIDGAAGAVDVVLTQLKSAGIPSEAVEEVTQALTDRIEIEVKAPGALLKPEDGDQACHILVISCKRFASDMGIIGAFIGFQSPLALYFPSTHTPVKFLMVFVGPDGRSKELSTLGDSVAALASDEALMCKLSTTESIPNFIHAVDEKLDNLKVMAHTHVATVERPVAKEESKPLSEKQAEQDEHVEQSSQHTHDPTWAERTCPGFMNVVSTMQKYSIPLVSGVLLALIWSNIDRQSYYDISHGYVGDGVKVFGHYLSLHFFVNDIFMCFFFGLAIKEVTEAVLPGGSLSPLKRAVNPLVATIGGVLGPAVFYVIAVCVLWALGSFEGSQCVTSGASGGGGHRRLGVGGGAGATGPTEPCSLGTLLRGWGVPTATDISLAWMFALLIFGAGHPAINFLLLLAIVDDALGMAIIAIYYPDPDNPVEPLWLALVILSIAVAIGLRKLNIRRWQVYVIVAGPISWLGLIKAHVHPALALVVVVPFMPAGRATRARSSVADLGAWDPSPESPMHSPKRKPMSPDLAAFVASRGHDTKVSLAAVQKAAIRAQTMFTLAHSDEAPLHCFEHEMKLPVDMGMFFFGFANAGVQLDAVGGLTVSVLIALIVGKTVGIAGCSMLAELCGFGLPKGVTMGDLWAMSALGGVGLTVALFVANEAFVDPDLQGQAKFAAVLSVASALVAKGIHFVAHGGRIKPDGSESLSPTASGDVEHGTNGDDLDGLNAVWNTDRVEDKLVDEILEMMWTQKRYRKRGVSLSLQRAHSGVGTPTRTGSKSRTTTKGRSSSKNSTSTAPQDVPSSCGTPPGHPGAIEFD